MAKIHRFKSTIYRILQSNKDGSYNTRATRKNMLYTIADDLYKGGFKLNTVLGLKTKHVGYLNELWKSQGLSAGTIKNRNACLRWMAAKINKSGIVPDNDDLKVERRNYITNENKAVDLGKVNLDRITNRRIYVQVHLQRHLGLRREESCKFKPFLADRGDHIYLYSSWCKGGRSRKVAINSKEARFWIDEAKKLVSDKNSSMIPKDKTYKQHRDLYDKQVQVAGIKHAHGLRHAYAHQRFREITGFECPACGGPIKNQLTKDQKILDKKAREQISIDLGHSRISVVSVYCGQ